jgi:hypothetical protein
LLRTQRITHCLNSHTATLTLFLDKEQACNKLRTTGHISRHLAQQECQLTAHSCLNNRNFAAVHMNSESSRRPILAAVPRGSLIRRTVTRHSQHCHTKHTKRQRCGRFAVCCWYKCHGSSRQYTTSY